MNLKFIEDKTQMFNQNGGVTVLEQRSIKYYVIAVFPFPKSWNNRAK